MAIEKLIDFLVRNQDSNIIVIYDKCINIDTTGHATYEEKRIALTSGSWDICERNNYLNCCIRFGMESISAINIKNVAAII